MTRIRVAVLASGSGTDLQSIIDASERGEIDADVVVVISNNPGAYALERAKRHDIDAHCVDHRGLSRRDHEDRIAEIIDSYDVDLIVLAGYLRMLTPHFIEKYRGKIINIHPALLPLFGGPGMHGLKVHEAVLRSGMKVSGCTVHFVDERIDGGPIILQRCVPIMEDDTPETLQKRVLEEEHKALPLAVHLFAHGRLRIDGDRVRVLPEDH